VGVALGMVILVLIKRKIPPTNWELMSPKARSRVLQGPKVDYDAIRKTYENHEGKDKEK